MNKLKEILEKIKKFVVLHKVASLSVMGVSLAAIVSVVIIVVVLSSHSSSNTVAGVETSEETMGISMLHLLDMEETTQETAQETEQAEETEEASDKESTASALEFEYEGKKVVISTGKPVELIPEEELEKKVEQDKSTTNIGGSVTVDEPEADKVKEPDKEENYEIIVDDKDSEEEGIYVGEAYAPLAGVTVGELDNSASEVGFTITDEAGNVVKSMSSEEVKKYNGNKEDIKVVFDKPGTYNIHYEFTAPPVKVTESISGIDVSHWQNDIDWGAVASQGYKFAMIKVAGRSIAEEGNLYEDDYFRQNIEGAIANGLKVGVYFFSQALSVQEAYEEASYILNLIKGYNITYPVAFDWETSSGYRTYNRLNRDELTEICEAFCDTVKSHGYQPMIYMSKNDWVNKVHTNRLTSKYNVWLAWYFYKYYYSEENRLYQEGDEVPDLDFGYNIWQYTSTGCISGVDGYCDMNVAFATTYKAGDTITKDISVNVVKRKEETTTGAVKEDETQNTTSTGNTTESTGATEGKTDRTTEATTTLTDNKTA